MEEFLWNIDEAQRFFRYRLIYGDRTSTELTLESAAAGQGGQSRRESPGSQNAREQTTLGSWCGLGQRSVTTPRRCRTEPGAVGGGSQDFTRNTPPGKLKIWKAGNLMRLMGLLPTTVPDFQDFRFSPIHCRSGGGHRTGTGGTGAETWDSGKLTRIFKTNDWKGLETLRSSASCEGQQCSNSGRSQCPVQAANSPLLSG